MQSFDAIIVGAGQAGPALAGRLTKAGWSVAFVERKLFGGTCVNTGCTPTKAMVASAHAAHLARRAAEFGVRVADVSIDIAAVIARREAIVAASRNGVEKYLRDNPKVTVFTGTASFVSPKVLRVGEEQLTAKHIFLNVGGRASVPEMPGVHDVPYLTNTSLLALDVLPKHLVIVGGSYIGIEFGQMYRRFGSEVTIIEKSSRLVPREDEDVSAGVREILEAEGVDIRLNSHATSVAKDGDGVAITLETDGKSSEIGGSHLLLATGRRPNTDDLGLENAGVKTDYHGYIEVDDQLRSSVPGIWALGDCNGKGAFTHTSYNDFEIVAANLLDNDPRRVSDRITTYGLFIDPPLGRAGMTEAQVRASGRKALIGTRPMTKVGRAYEKSETQGFMKILVDAETKEILGAAMLGTGGDEAIHCILDVMYARKPYTVIQRAVHIHPTVSELIPTMLGELKPFQSGTISSQP